MPNLSPVKPRKAAFATQRELHLNEEWILAKKSALRTGTWGLRELLVFTSFVIAAFDIAAEATAAELPVTAVSGYDYVPVNSSPEGVEAPPTLADCRFQFIIPIDFSQADPIARLTWMVGDYWTLVFKNEGLAASYYPYNGDQTEGKDKNTYKFDIHYGPIDNAQPNPDTAQKRHIFYNPAYIWYNIKLVGNVMGGVYPVAHEFGHHVQWVGRRETLWPVPPESLRNSSPGHYPTTLGYELDADRLAGAFIGQLVADKTITPECSEVALYTIALANNSSVDVDDPLADSHGSTAQRQKCFKEGYEHGPVPFFLNAPKGDMPGCTAIPKPKTTSGTTSSPHPKTSGASPHTGACNPQPPGCWRDLGNNIICPGGPLTDAQATWCRQCCGNNVCAGLACAQ